MVTQKQKWTSEEEEALLAGIRKHGQGKWKNILEDPEFAPLLKIRSNVDLKDKWRNLKVSVATLVSKEKTMPPQIDTASTSHTDPDSASNATFQNLSLGTINKDTLDVPQDVKNAPNYKSMIFEAITALNDRKGSTITAIVDFIKEKYEVPLTFKRTLSENLGQLVENEELEKVRRNLYKIKNETLVPIKTPISKQKDRQTAI